MTRDEHLKLLEEKMKRNLEIARKKNNDYCGKNEDADPFSNFRLTEIFSKGRVTTEDGIFTRMTDKVARIGTLLGQDAQVKDESIQDCLNDLSNYSLILSNFLDSKKSQETKLEKNSMWSNSDFIGRGDTIKIISDWSGQKGSVGTVLDVSENEELDRVFIVVNIDDQRFVFCPEDLCKI